MDIATVHFFIKAVKSGSINKAAQELYMNHQNLGKKLSKLEDELDLTLLARTATGISLTEDGEALYEKFLKLDAVAKEIEAYAATVHLQRKEQEENRVNLTILLSRSIFPKKVSKAIIEMEERFPQSNISVIDSSLENSLEKVYQMENVFANIVVPARQFGAFPKDIAIWKEKIHKLVAYVPKWMLPGQQEIEIQDLLAMPVVLYSNSGKMEENAIYKELMQYGQPFIKHCTTNYVNFCELMYTKKHVTVGWYRAQAKYYPGDTFSEFMLKENEMRVLLVKYKGKTINAKVLWVSRKDIMLRPEIEFLMKIL